eukprot:15085555-Alexandrium_andersonii.AAC.1
MALGFLQDELHRVGLGKPDNLRFRSACDIKKSAQMLLCSMKEPHRPEHVYNDILDKLPSDVAEYL